jgi:pullulanase/glycogen debranching enzyme
MVSDISASGDRGRSAVRDGSAADLMRSADLVRAGLAGSLRDYVMTTWRDELLPLSKIDDAGRPAGYANQPGEVVNHVENHDNLTLPGANVVNLPMATSREVRARAQHLGSAIVAFSQGIAYFQAGQEFLRGKPTDSDSRESRDAGDGPERLDWTPAEMRWASEAFADLLKLRASSTLFRLRTAADVQARLLFHNTGSVQVPTVLVGHLDGVGLPGAVFRELVYLINVDPVAQTVAVEPLKDRPFELHPVHTAPGAADRRAAAATFDMASGDFTVPGLTAVVFVVR